MPILDSPQLLAAKLRGTDLAMSASLLEAKLAKCVGNGVHIYRPVAVKGMARTWIVAAYSDDDIAPHPFLLQPNGGVVKAVRLLKDEEGVCPTEFRKVGTRVIGLAWVYQGNWSTPLAVVFRITKGGWVRTSSIEGEHEGHVTFANAKSNDAICLTRSYDFRQLSQPHAGPLLTLRSDWRYRNGAFHAGPSRLVHNAIYAFDDLIEGWMTGNQKILKRRCPNPIFRTQLSAAVALTHHFSVTCPLSVERDQGHIFGLATGTHDVKIPYFEMGLVKGQWQVIRVASESYFVKRDHIRR